MAFAFDETPDEFVRRSWPDLVGSDRFDEAVRSEVEHRARVARGDAAAMAQEAARRVRGPRGDRRQWIVRMICVGSDNGGYFVSVTYEAGTRAADARLVPGSIEGVEIRRYLGGRLLKDKPGRSP